jgi:ABC-type transport system involved in cytochrome c biogenesis permease subunit
MNTTILSVATFVYLGAFVVFLIAVVSEKDLWGKAGSLMAAGGFILQSAGMAIRWFESYQSGMGHAPLSNFYESLVFFSWAVAFFSFVWGRGRGRSLINVCAMAAAALFMAYASFSPGVDSRIQPLIPALKSNWLIIHVMTCFLGYASFVVASIAGVLFLVKKGDASEGEALGEMLYRSTAVGFIIFTLGIVTGSVWAYAAWGRYWGWDPKETWALITWLIYAGVLHTRIRERGVNNRVAVMALVGLASVLFTYFGVNYLPGLHSYR